MAAEVVAGLVAGCSAEITRTLRITWALDCRVTDCSAGMTRALEITWALDCRATISMKAA
jgi:hypothetical protein